MTEDFDVDGELGFEPAVPVTGAERDDDSTPRAKRPRQRRRLGRKLSAAVVLLTALFGMGGAYAMFAGGSAGAAGNAQDIQAGKQLYETSCITCHGANLQGVKDRGVPLLGVGGAAVYFQVSTGRMPLAGQGAEATRKTPKFDEQQTEQIAAYVQSVGGGPTIPDGSLRDDAKMADGGELFRLNCASCHGTTGRGAPLSAGKQIPGLVDANDKQMYSAMLTGPENMPIFSDNQLTPDQKKQIISYIQTLKASKDPGGHGIGRIGPVSEAIVIWVAGIGALVIVILWIGVKAE